jgi:hypothetical protein
VLGIDPAKLISLFGLTFASVGLAARLGLWIDWYWRTRGSVYSYVPLGLLFMLYAFNDQAPQRFGQYYIVYQALLALLMIFGAWWSLRPPDWIKPTWVRWVEEYPDTTREAMQKAVEDGEDWQPHMASRESLEAWVKTLRPRKAKSKRRG